jgi:dTDP-4-dehydrorhamnose reductase
MSTDLVFDGERNDAYTEDDVPSPMHEYGYAKADAEHAVLAALPSAAVVRTSILYTRSHDDRQTRAALDLLEGRASGGLFVDELRSPTCANDLAAALLELAENDYTGVLHVAGSDVLSRHALGVALLTAAGYDASALPCARSAEQAVRRPLRCVLRSVRRGAIATRIRGAYEVLATEQRR